MRNWFTWVALVLVFLACGFWIESGFFSHRLLLFQRDDLRIGIISSAGELQFIEHDDWYPEGLNDFPTGGIEYSMIVIGIVIWWACAKALPRKVRRFHLPISLSIFVLISTGITWMGAHRYHFAISACITNLKMLESAKEQWALDNKSPKNAAPGWKDLIGTNRYIRQMVRCPRGGKYTLGNLAERPRCTISEHNLGVFY